MATDEIQGSPGENSQKKPLTVEHKAGPPGTGDGGGITREMILARFIRLCSASLSTPVPREAAAIIVNRISEIVHVDRAVLVNLTGKNSIQAVTGGGAAAQDSSFADAVDTVKRMYKKRREPILVPKAAENSIHITKIQQAMNGTEILWVPLRLNRGPGVPLSYALWLERWNSVQWENYDVELLHHISIFLGRSMENTASKTGSWKRMRKIGVCLALLALLLFPVKSSVTAPARIIPDRPHYVFAPMDGILKDLFVQPGQAVKKGEKIFRYDSRVLEKRLEEARKNVAVAQAKLVRLEGASLRDPQARSELPAQQLEVERAKADVEFYAEQLARAEVTVSKSGVIVLDDPDALVGAAIRTGQSVLSVAEPSRTKLHIMVPASDVGFLKEGAQVKIRLDSDPFTNIPASITRIGFEVKLSENQVPSVLAEAIWIGETPGIQPGQKGSAKIYGKTTPLGMQILRKPLIAIRNITGF